MNMEYSNRNSIKDIAKNAVVAEIKKQNRSRGKRKHCVDSSDDEDEQPQYCAKGFKHDDGVVTHKDSEQKRLEVKYRDRAKERVQWFSTDVHFDDADKFETAVSLSEQVFEDVIDAVESGDRQKLKVIANLTNTAEHLKDTEFPSSAIDALTWITTSQSLQTTQLGKDVFFYLRTRYVVDSDKPISESAAGRSIQQSILTFSNLLNIYPQDYFRSWERPLEQTFARPIIIESSNTTDNIISKASVCNQSLIQKVMNILDKQETLRENKEPAKKSTLINDVSKNNAKNSKSYLSLEKTESDKGGSDGDSDDNIFANVGEYDVDNIDQDHNERKEQPSVLLQLETTNRSQKSMFGDTVTKPEGRTIGAEINTMIFESDQIIDSLRSSRGYDDNDEIDLDFDGAMDNEEDEFYDDTKRKSSTRNGRKRKKKL